MPEVPARERTVDGFREVPERMLRRDQEGPARRRLARPPPIPKVSSTRMTYQPACGRGGTAAGSGGTVKTPSSSPMRANIPRSTATRMPRLRREGTRGSRPAGALNARVRRRRPGRIRQACPSARHGRGAGGTHPPRCRADGGHADPGGCEPPASDEPLRRPPPLGPFLAIATISARRSLRRAEGTYRHERPRPSPTRSQPTGSGRQGPITQAAG